MVIWLSQPLLLSWLWFTLILISHCQSEKKIPKIVPTDLTCKDQKRQEILQMLTDRRILVRTEVIKQAGESILHEERMSASIKQIWNIVASRPKFVFTPTLIFCSPICSNSCGVVFLWKYILVFEKWLFLFDCSNMNTKYEN